MYARARVPLAQPPAALAPRPARTRMRLTSGCDSMPRPRRKLPAARYVRFCPGCGCCRAARRGQAGGVAVVEGAQQPQMSRWLPSTCGRPRADASGGKSIAYCNSGSLTITQQAPHIAALGRGAHAAAAAPPLQPPRCRRLQPPCMCGSLCCCSTAGAVAGCWERGVGQAARGHGACSVAVTEQSQSPSEGCLI